MKSSQRTLLVWLFLVVATLLLFQNAQSQRKESKISFAEFIGHVQTQQIESVTFKNHGKISGKFKDNFKEGQAFETVGDTSSEFYTKLLHDAGLIPNYELEGGTSIWMQFLIGWGPMLLIFVVLLFFLKQVQSTGGKAMQFGRSKAKLLSEGRVKVTFKDVAGCDEAKEELAEVVHFLRDPKKFTKLGGKIPKGILLMGPPGTGKTLLAKAVAGEAIVPFFTISGSDFVEMFVGVGASRVRDLFDQGKKHAPCIIFIDEIDAVGRQRGAGLGGGHDEREQTLNQLLVEMDGFDSQEGVILVAATNRPDVLDPALLRPGRFDRSVTVGKPDIVGRRGILEVHARNKPMASDINLDVIARQTPGFSGADLHNLVNESALLAARADKKEITMREMELAKDKVIMGPERRSMVISDEEKEKIAYHEAGHAIVGMSLPGLDPVHKVTIIPRGMALGVTQTLPSEDMLNMTRSRAEKMISFLMGGTLAEELIFGERTTGAGSDIQRASDIARKMVCEWGFSEVIGPMTVAKPQGDIFLGREIQNSKGDMSEKTSELVDDEVRKIIMDNYRVGEKILEQKRDILKSMAEALLERETLHDHELKCLMEKRPLPPFNPHPDLKADTEVRPTQEKEKEAAPLAPLGSTDTEVA